MTFIARASMALLALGALVACGSKSDSDSVGAESGASLAAQVDTARIENAGRSPRCG